MRHNRPEVSSQEACTIAREVFGIAGRVQEVAAEIDRNFLVIVEDEPRAVLKVSPPQAERVELDAQVALLEHLGASDDGVRTPAVLRAPTGETIVRYTTESGPEVLVRLLGFIPGIPLAKLDEVPLGTLEAFGRLLGGIDLGLRSFDHPGAHREHPWDLTRMPALAPALEWVEDVELKGLVERGLERFHDRLGPALGELRRGVIHNDANDHNLLLTSVDSAECEIAGLIDFGDMLHTVTVAEPAIAAAYAMLHTPDPVAGARAVVRGYEEHLPLTAGEHEALPGLILSRLCSSALMAAEASRRVPGDAYLDVSRGPVSQLLKTLEGIGFEDLDLRSRARKKPFQQEREVAELLQIRRDHLGPNLSISYTSPLKIVRGEGQYLYDSGGRRFLDLVNNVCHVGHCHPRVVAAGQRQMALLNTNTRYLHDNLAEYVERLTAHLPDPLSVCFLTCSGSEANNLALRLARAHTGSREILVIDHGYHGNSPELIEISPYKCEGPGGQGLAPYAHKVAMADTYRGLHRGADASDRYVEEVVTVTREIVATGRRVGAMLAEPLVGCGGQVVPPEGYLARSFEAVRAAGGVCIADEVQVGFGRVGTHMWAFENQGASPDIVTLGKPIGNGHPMAAVVTTPEIARSFDTGMEYFNTFGGNPVSCAIGLAVLDVIETEDLQGHALRIGERMLKGLRELQERHELVGDARGVGLYLGLELVEDRDTRQPAAAAATRVIDQMKERGFLLSTDGPDHNVIKIKPPMVLTATDVDETLSALDETLGALEV